MNREEQLELCSIALHLTDYEGITCSVDYRNEPDLGCWMTVYLVVDDYVGLWTINQYGRDGITHDTIMNMLHAIMASILRGGQHVTH